MSIKNWPHDMGSEIFSSMSILSLDRIITHQNKVYMQGRHAY